MCGIVGYVGKHNAQQVIIQGLEKLEYQRLRFIGYCGNRQERYAERKVQRQTFGFVRLSQRSPF